MRPTMSARPSNIFKVAASASAICGIAMAASRLSGYHTLRCRTAPSIAAHTAIAPTPTSPPLTPADSGCTSTGNRKRCRSSPNAKRSTVRAGAGGDTVVIGVTGTCSSCSSGSTHRHHPTPPTRARATPTTLTARWVTSPANPRVTPSATTIGHGVGAGSAMLPGSVDRLTACPSSSNYVDHREDDDPHAVHEVPVPGDELDALGMDGLEDAGACEDEAEAQHEESENHVRRVQADERIERGPEEIRTDREAPLDDEVVPLTRRAPQQRGSARDGDEQPHPGSHDSAGGERRRRQCDGDAARQQAHGAGDRQGGGTSAGRGR